MRFLFFTFRCIHNVVSFFEMSARCFDMSLSEAIRECPVSRHPLNQPAMVESFGENGRHWSGRRFDCPHCGEFIVDEFELNHLMGYLNPPPLVVKTNVLQQSRQRAVLAHALRRMAASNARPVLTDGMTLRILQEDRLPSLSEQRDNLLRWLGYEVEIGRTHSFGHGGLGARVGSASAGTFRLLLQGMVDEGLLRGKFALDDSGVFELTHEGLKRLEQLERAMPSGDNAFMAMQFGNKTLDRIVDDFFRGAVKEAGFNLYRLDDRPEAGLIDARLRNEIRNCRFLIADLSHANAGSYWEAGYAEGLGKPVIYTCEKNVFEGRAANVGKPHFDTNHHLTIIWDETEPQSAANRLRETIQFTIPESQQANSSRSI